MSEHKPIVIETQSKDVPWWLSEREFHKETRDLMKSYAGVEEDQVNTHLARFRDEAWNIRPYPCIGMWWFLRPVIQWAQIDHEYEAILERIKAGDAMLDVGCALGQDLRRLAADGAPTNNMYATDIISGFWEASFGLFRDRDKLQATFICGDFFDPDSALLRQKAGAFDVISCGDFLHLFSWERQIEAGKRLVALSRARPGAMIIGKQIGSSPPKEAISGWGKKDAMFFHDEASMYRLWDEVQTLTDTRWDVKVHIAAFGSSAFWSPKEDFEWMGPTRHGVQFVLERL